jgi:hypothetical protein
MSPPKVLEDLASIVLVGSFNPAIFQPAWLAAKGLIRESEASGAAIEVIHPEISQFRADWLHLSVATDKFVASTRDPAHRAPLRDLVVGIFDLLDQTPTSRMGLNRSMQVDVEDDEKWHALGHLIAPKEPWAGILVKPGTRTLLMEAARGDGLPGKTFFRVEPSQRFPHAVFVDVNSEFHLDPKRPNETTSYFVGRVREDWERIMREAHVGMEKLVGHVMKKEGQ